MRTPELLTALQVAEILHMRADSVVRKIHRGELDAVKVGTKWLVKKESLDALLSSAPQGT
jgi:excisionase family DNA binding protein